MNRQSLFVLALLAGASPFALAADPDARPTPPEKAAPHEETPPPATTPGSLSDAKLPEFATLDVDRDASISRAEASGHAGLAAIFNECDVNRDGSLSTWEFAEARQKLGARSHS
jgi:hypothetical protein